MASLSPEERLRRPWTRDAQTDKDKMSLPPGKICADCYSFNRCKKAFGCNPANEVCVFAPSAFIAVRSPRDVAEPCAEPQSSGPATAP